MINRLAAKFRRHIHVRQTFTALKYRNYRLWFWGQMVSLFGTWMQGTAQLFLIFELTKSPLYLGLAGFANGIPTWLFMLYAGVVSDRVSRRKVMLITQTSMMVLAFITAGLTFSHVVRPWHLIALAFCFGISNAFDAPPRQAIVTELVDPEDMTNAIALNSTMFNTGQALGPALSGVTYALFGPAWCFTINGLSFIAVIAALAKMRLAPFVSRPQKNSVMDDLKEGVRYVAAQPLIRTIISLVGVVGVFGIAFATLMPAWAVKVLHGNSTTNGVLQAVRGFGALISALMIASLGRFKFRGKLLTFGSFAFPLLLLAFAFVRWLPLSLIVLFGVGFAQILIFNLANATIQSLTRDDLRGRVMSIYALTFFGLLPFGALWIGWMAGHVGEAAAIIVNAAAIFVYAGFVFAAMPRLRRVE